MGEKTSPGSLGSLLPSPSKPCAVVCGSQTSLVLRDYPCVSPLRAVYSLHSDWA